MGARETLAVLEKAAFHAVAPSEGAETAGIMEGF